MNSAWRPLLTVMLIFLLGCQWLSSPLVTQAADIPATTDVGGDLCDAGAGSGSITGKVTRASDGTAVDGADVKVYDLLGNLETGANSKVDGTYQVNGLAASSYMVKADFEDVQFDGKPFYAQYYKGQESPSSFTAVQVQEGKTTANIDFALKSGVIIQGVVTDAATNKPIASVVVTIHDSASESLVFTTVFTDDKGHYTSGNLPPGSYKVSFSNFSYQSQYHNGKSSFADADTIKLTGVQTASANAKLTAVVAQPTGQIIGKITTADTHVAMKKVSIVAISVETGFAEADAAVDEQGVYTLSAPAGVYAIKAGPYSGDELDYAEGFYRKSGESGPYTTISVAGNNKTTGINIALAHGAHVTGRVTQQPGGAGVDSASINVSSGNGDLAQSVFARADSSGFYTTAAVSNGVYTVTVTAYQSCLLVSQVDKDKVTVTKPGIISGVNFVLQTGGLTMGRLTNAKTGAGVSSLVVIENAAGETVGTTFSATTGYYRSLALAPGKYYVHAKPVQGSGLGNLYYGQTEARDKATLVEIKASQMTSKIDISLSAAAVVEPSQVQLYMPALARR